MELIGGELKSHQGQYKYLCLLFRLLLVCYFTSIRSHCLFSDLYEVEACKNSSYNMGHGKKAQQNPNKT
jgi:hypothetical protein